jgi:RNA polymerase sigma-70 factor (ECF subfamily)
MEVARNRVLDALRRDRSLRDKWSEVAEYELRLNGNGPDRLDLIESELKDDQLRMIFTCCHPAVSREAQLALTLKTVGGFGVSEIARAFLTSEATIAQRLVRAKRSIRLSGVPFETPDRSQISGRLDSVLETLYLLFSEGYSAHEGDDLIRHDLCAEAVRLCSLVARNPLCDLPKVHALFALMLLQLSRLPARTDTLGDIILLEDQDRSLWDRTMINEGMRELDLSASGEELSKYHLEAGIASLQRYYFYYATKGEMERRAGLPERSTRSLQRAMELSPTEVERRFLSARKELSLRVSGPSRHGRQ